MGNDRIPQFSKTWIYNSRNKEKRMMRALIVKSPWAGQIVTGMKTVEYRSHRTHIRGRIGIVAAGTGTIIGGVDLIGCEGPFDGLYHWLLANPTRYIIPKHYHHPSGAQVWVRISS